MGLFVEEASVWRRMCESVKMNRLDEMSREVK